MSTVDGSLQQRAHLLVAAPMRIEAALIASASRTLKGAGWPLVHKTGIGPTRSKVAADRLASADARALLVVGFCGGLDASSVPGEVIVAEDVYAAQDEGHAEQRVPCELAGQLVQRLAGRGMKVRTGSVVCVSRLALGERRAQLQAGGAIAVDMESVWLAAGAARRPFGVVRVVLDSPEHELLRVRAAVGALRAALALRGVAGALHEWVPAF
jgi:4-hydroxy-3-methylbut-2-en-1-yl diphosphate reductase